MDKRSALGKPQARQPGSHFRFFSGDPKSFAGFHCGDSSPVKVQKCPSKLTFFFLLKKFRFLKTKIQDSRRQAARFVSLINNEYLHNSPPPENYFQISHVAT